MRAMNKLSLVMSPVFEEGNAPKQASLPLISQAAKQDMCPDSGVWERGVFALKEI